MILQESIDHVLDSVIITDVIKNFVSLTKKGVNWIGNCPFHDENTPSFSVSPTKGIFKCFGCGVGGNAVKFLMMHERLTFPEAIKHLANEFNVQINETKSSKADIERQDKLRLKKESLFIIYNSAADFYHTNLLNKLIEEIKGWGFKMEEIPDLETAKEFQIGYVPNEWQLLYNHLRKKGFKHDAIIESGLVIEKDKKLYDMFRNRIMFPIHNRWGDVIAFSGRYHGDSKRDKQPKYINSAESILYQKSKVLYGIFQAKSALSKSGVCNIVEGNFDVTKMHHIGLKNTISANGTSISSDQIKTILRFCNDINLIYDGDDAGRKAIFRNGETCLKEGIIPIVLPLPEGEDPDSYFHCKTFKKDDQLTQEEILN